MELTLDQIRKICSEHVESQLDLHFCSIAEEFDAEYGDITPDQALRLSEINDLLTELSVEYVIQNTNRIVLFNNNVYRL